MFIIQAVSQLTRNGYAQFTRAGPDGAARAACRLRYEAGRIAIEIARECNTSFLCRAFFLVAYLAEHLFRNLDFLFLLLPPFRTARVFP